MAKEAKQKEPKVTPEAPAARESASVKAVDFKAPIITAKDIMAAHENSLKVGRESRLQKLARSNKDVAWLLDQFSKTKEVKK